MPESEGAIGCLNVQFAMFVSRVGHVHSLICCFNDCMFHAFPLPLLFLVRKLCASILFGFAFKEVHCCTPSQILSYASPQARRATPAIALSFPNLLSFRNLPVTILSPQGRNFASKSILGLCIRICLVSWAESCRHLHENQLCLFGWSPGQLMHE